MGDDSGHGSGGTLPADLFLRAILQQSPTPTWISDESGTLIQINPACCELLGIEAADVIGVYNVRRDSIVSAQGLLPQVEAVYRGGQTAHFTIEYDTASLAQLHLPGGRSRILEVTIHPVRDEQDRVIHAVIQHIDITERVRVEEELRRSEARWRSLTETSPDHILTLDRDLNIEFANFASPGLTVAQLRGTPLHTYVEPERQEEVRGILEGVLRTGREAGYETQYPTPDGGIIYYESRVVPRRLREDGDIIGLTVSARDISARRRAEQELVRTHRLRAVAELAAGVSHNLNNILTAILGPAQLLARRPLDPQARREVDEITFSARRAAELVRELNLSVRRPDEEELEAVPVADTVLQAVHSARPRWRDEPQSRGVTIEVTTAFADLPPVRATASGLHHAVTNLLFNAVDAMPWGGVIEIEARRAGGHMEIACRDTGVGMDESTRLRVFEPFFTTKADIGTGLGLAVVHSAVARWGGSVTVESAPGQGSTFTLRLVPWGGAADQPVAAVAASGAMGARRLLVVDDDELVCRLLARLLGEHHEVDTADDARQALAAFAAGRYDAVLADLGMAGMAGDQVLRAMREQDPSVATVMITGWALSDTDPRLQPVDFLLQKPFADLDEVEATVGRAIALCDRRRAGQA